MDFLNRISRRDPVEPSAAIEGLLDRAVFVCGRGRSGSSLLLRLFDGHPQVYVIPRESRLLTEIAPALRRTGDVFRDRRAWTRRRWGSAAVAVFLGLVVVDFVWMWPIFTGGLRTYDVWHAHMWLPSWV